MQADRSGQSLNTNPAKSALAYQQLRSPRDHGETLQVPPFSEAEKLWTKNVAFDQREISVGEILLSDLKRLGREEVAKLAFEYTGEYLDIQNPPMSFDKIVMAGHQPQLFHPGVWYKNFALSRLGQQFKSVAINLIVDNDVCGNPSIRFPKVDGENVSVGTIPVTQPGSSVPFEARKIDDWAFFEKFPGRVNDAIKPLVENPLANRLWKSISYGRKLQSEMRLGQTIAMARHCLENEIGLSTLEVPVSRVSQTNAFALFAKFVLVEIKRFQSAYNAALVEYRQVHKVRSKSHPVPELESDGDWFESPFWVWQIDQPNRRRLFTRQIDGKIQLTDRADWQVELAAQSFCEQFRDLTSRGVAIRPKALTTTMFSRLILCDLFLHGIGGAKYDQLTDEIAKRFFGVAPPEFMTLSATMKLPHNFETADRSDIVRTGQLIRELQFHPELHVPNEKLELAQSMIEAKKECIGQSKIGISKDQHDSIVGLNQQLQPLVEPSLEGAMQNLQRMQSRLRSSEILNSREYSFCLFPESLINELREI